MSIDTKKYTSEKLSLGKMKNDIIGELDILNKKGKLNLVEGKKKNNLIAEKTYISNTLVSITKITDIINNYNSNQQFNKDNTEEISRYLKITQDYLNFKLEMLTDELTFELKNKNFKDIYTDLTTHLEGKDKCGDPSCIAIIKKLVNDLNGNSTHLELFNKLTDIIAQNPKTGGAQKRKHKKSTKRQHNDVIFF